MNLAAGTQIDSGTGALLVKEVCETGGSNSISFGGTSEGSSTAGFI